MDFVTWSGSLFHNDEARKEKQLFPKFVFAFVRTTIFLLLA